MYNFYFLANAIGKQKLYFGKEDSERDAGKAAAGTDVHHLRAVFQAANGSYSEGMQHMPLVEAVNVFAGDDVYLRVPFFIQRAERSELLMLGRREIGKVFADYFQRCFVFHRM